MSIDRFCPVLLTYWIYNPRQELRILHSKGEGVLRSVIRDQLKQTKGIASVADEHVERGGGWDYRGSAEIKKAVNLFAAFNGIS